jgi:hypothetical protein
MLVVRKRSRKNGRFQNEPVSRGVRLNTELTMPSGSIHLSYPFIFPGGILVDLWLERMAQMEEFT